MKVSDIMTREVISVKPSDKVIEVADLLYKKGFNGVPVVEDGKVLGMITEADLISRGPTSVHIPSLIKIFHELKLEGHVRDKYNDNLRSILEARASSIMNSNYVSVGPETEITELLEVFQEKHMNPIPVVDKDKRLLGIVSLSDIIRLVSRFREVEIDFLETGR